MIARRSLLAAAALTPFASLAQTAAPTPAVLVGGFAVFPLLDGIFPLSLDMIPDAKNPEGEALLAAAGRPAMGPDPLPVNGYLVRHGTEVTLIDAGGGGLLGPTLGRLPALLETMGLAPVAVTRIISTHLHADHVGGLLTAGGGARFPQAELIVQESEAQFWADDAARAQAPKGMDDFFVAARTTLAAYKGRTRLVNGAAELAPGMTAMSLPGHTPGHMGVLLNDGTERLLVWGDIIHSTSLQLPHPAWTVVFDVDPAMAAATRARVLDMTASDGVRVAGMHMAQQGRIEKRVTGYALVG